MNPAPRALVELLLDVMRRTPSANGRAVILQSYIAEFGPIPDEAAGAVRAALAGAKGPEGPGPLTSSGASATG